MKPLDIVVIDQYIDRTKHRKDSFFEEGIIAHVSPADPVCPIFKKLVVESVEGLKLPESKVHNGGTYICIEGPAFSSKAESHMYRMWGGSVIGMTAVPEVKLAREAEMAYACVTFVTDFDCWHPDHDNVTVEMVVQTLKKNGDNAQLIVKEVVKKLSQNQFDSASHGALKYSILTHKEHVPASTVQKLQPLLAKYFN
eukprot:TRINITY_DN436_c0_g1_i10.p1 TRINITY_DN436_c0_g1~~TRINITY_DN436_c0_g1_i10.p1  ORF type:complete len:197 (-),score=47.69 TRINITY_DN436_c0_g1_i10:330-920(-)